MQAPLHSLNSEPEVAAGLRVTSVPSSYSASQVAPQLIPAGVEVTVPVPLPDLETVSLNLGLTIVLKVAVRALLASIANEQGEVVQPAAEPVPALKPAKVEPAFAVAITSTAVALGWGLVQAPAEPPLNLHLTSPVPVPALAIVRVRAIRSNLAPTALAALIVTLQAPEPVQAPVHSLNSEPALAD